jgi:hypothetical protein
VLSGTTKEESQAALIAFTSPSYEFKTRVNAFEALKRLNVCDETIVNNGYQAQGSFNGRLSSPVKTVLDYYASQDAYKKIMVDCYKKCSDPVLKTKLKSSFGFL